MHFVVVEEKCSIEQVCEEGSIFKSVTKSDVLKPFLTYFDIRGASATEIKKALHLKKLAEQASKYFQSKNKMVWQGKSETSVDFLRHIFNTKKTTSRRNSTKDKSLEERVLSGTIFHPRDFMNCTKEAQGKLDEMMRYFQKRTRDERKPCLDFMSSEAT